MLQGLRSGRLNGQKVSRIVEQRQRSATSSDIKAKAVGYKDGAKSLHQSATSQ